MTEFEENQWLRDDSIEYHYDMFHNVNSSDEVRNFLESAEKLRKRYHKWNKKKIYYFFQVMGILREHAPRKFVIILGFVALFEKNIQHIDTTSEKFLRNVCFQAFRHSSR